MVHAFLMTAKCYTYCKLSVCTSRHAEDVMWVFFFSSDTTTDDG